MKSVRYDASTDTLYVRFDTAFPAKGIEDPRTGRVYHYSGELRGPELKVLLGAEIKLKEIK